LLFAVYFLVGGPRRSLLSDFVSFHSQSFLFPTLPASDTYSSFFGSLNTEQSLFVVSFASLCSLSRAFTFLALLSPYFHPYRFLSVQFPSIGVLFVFPYCSWSTQFPALTFLPLSVHFLPIFLSSPCSVSVRFSVCSAPHPLRSLSVNLLSLAFPVCYDACVLICPSI
jgi:hypothetical protein